MKQIEERFWELVGGDKAKEIVGTIDKYSISDDSLTLIKYLDTDRQFTISIEYLDLRNGPRPNVENLFSIEGYKSSGFGWKPILLRYCNEGHQFISILNETLEYMKKAMNEG